jgi:hypothetical protein
MPAVNYAETKRLTELFPVIRLFCVTSFGRYERKVDSVEMRMFFKQMSVKIME